MEASILTSTKKVIGIAEDDTTFDLDIIIHINSVFATLQQIGVGPEEGFMIEDDSAEWDDYLEGDNGLNNVKTYMFLKVKMFFDPPQTSVLLTAMEKQVDQLEARINTHREWMLDPVDPMSAA